MPAETMKHYMGGELWVSPQEAADLLGVTPRHIRRLAAKGHLRFQRSNGRGWVQMASVRRYRDQRNPWPPAGIYGGARTAREQNLTLPWLEDDAKCPSTRPSTAGRG